MPHIFVGYPFDTKGYKVLNLESKRIPISRDVTFHKDVFPFAISPTTGSFPSTIHSIPLIIDLPTNAHQSTIDGPLNLDNINAAPDELIHDHYAGSPSEPQPFGSPITTSQDLAHNTLQNPSPV